MKIENGLRLYFRNLKPGCDDCRLPKFILVLVMFFLPAIQRIQAQHPTDYTIQANIIYRFTKYVDWPGTKKSGDFIIGIVGDSPLADELESFILNKTVGNQKIVVKNIPASALTFNCHILFISEDKSSNLKKIVSRTAGSAILIVSESEGLALRGSCINFIIVSDHLKLEINKNNIERRGMGIASELLQLGIAVK